jgi:hypothetical protein
MLEMFPSSKHYRSDQEAQHMHLKVSHEGHMGFSVFKLFPCLHSRGKTNVRVIRNIFFAST